MKYERRNMNVRHKTLADARQSTVAGGFTLIELITVIIIIGIMIGVALPKYMQLSEKTKASNAKQIMDMLRKAEEAYYIEASEYTTYDANTDAAADIIGAGGIPHSKLIADLDWNYGVVVGSDTNTFTVTAGRKTGVLEGTGCMSWIKDDSIRYCSSAGCDESSENAAARKNWK